MMSLGQIELGFLSNFAFFSNVAWAISHREWVTYFYLDILDKPWALCLTWLLMATLLKKFLHISEIGTGVSDLISSRTRVALL